MKRIFIFLLGAMLLTASAGAAVWPAWGNDALIWAQQASIDKTFLDAPDAYVTRGMAARLMYEAAGRPEVSAECPVSDVSDAEADAVAWAAKQGYVTGVGDGYYDPDRTVMRQELAAILYRQAGLPAVVGQNLGKYQDRKEIASWAVSPMLWCVQTEIVRGKSADLIAPEDPVTVAEALTMLKRAAELPDVSGIHADLHALTAVHRPVGSQGENGAVQYLKKRFTEMGYEVTLQSYEDGQGRKGSNVVAVKAAPLPNADILVLSAHHDSVPTAYGANDNASGVAALLYVAELLQDIPTDTEVRFISFTDEENGKCGSRFYTSSLAQAEKERMVGNIQFDMLGGLGTEDALVCTMDGEANWVSDLLQQQDSALRRGRETASDHASLQLAGVPSVLLMQNGRGYLYYSAADTAEQLNPYAIARTAERAGAAVKEILSADTPSYRALAREQGQNYTYRQTRQNVIYFGSSRSDTEAYIGAAGEWVDTHEVKGEGWTDVYDTYRYAMRWFDEEPPIHTYYQYRNGFLERIELRPEETGYTQAQVRAAIEAMYGAPASEEQGRSSWADPVYSKYITLSTDEQGALVTVSNYSVGITNVLSSYQVKGGQVQIADPKDRAVWEYLCTILPLEARQKITQFNLFSDGYSNILAYTSPVEENSVTDNSRFCISIDYYDVYDENGARRDWSKLTYTILHEYGHVLLEDETQVDLTKGDSTHDPASFVEGSFRYAFYQTFWKDLGDSAVSDYEVNPTHYVSRYGANYFHEDIADTFAVFVLGGEPEGDTVAEQKLKFFWNDTEMTALRDTIRQQLGLEAFD